MVSSRRGRVFKDGIPKIWIGFAIAIAALGGALACNAILGLGDYAVGDGGTSTTPGDGSPFSADCGVTPGQCYPCTPTNNDQLQNACTTSNCVPFDDFARIPGFDGGLPFVPVPPPDGG
ncbi:MAG: hypothetical protein ABI183_05040 [Polyangiaceae bacterium]